MRDVKILRYESADLLAMEKHIEELIAKGYEISGYSVCMTEVGESHSVIMVQKPADPRMAMFNITQWERDGE